MTTAFAYPATLETDTGGRVVVSFRDLDGAHTDGAHRAEALREAEDCLHQAIAVRLLRHEPIPAPSRPRESEVMVPVPLRTAAKAMLAMTLQDAGIGPRELARRLGCDAKEASRLLDPRYASKIDRLAEAVRLLGGPTLELHARKVA